MPTYAYNRIHTVADLRHVMTEAGSHFFSPGAMRGFNSRIHRGVVALDGHDTEEGSRFLFLTSEQFKPYDGPPAPRDYNVRMVTLTSQRDDRPNTDVWTLEKFATVAEARVFMRAAKNRPACGVMWFGEPCNRPATVDVWEGRGTPRQVCGYHA